MAVLVSESIAAPEGAGVGPVSDAGIGGLAFSCVAPSTSVASGVSAGAAVGSGVSVGSAGVVVVTSNFVSPLAFFSSEAGSTLVDVAEGDAEGVVVALEGAADVGIAVEGAEAVDFAGFFFFLVFLVLVTACEAPKPRNYPFAPHPRPGPVGKVGWQPPKKRFSPRAPKRSGGSSHAPIPWQDESERRGGGRGKVERKRGPGGLTIDAELAHAGERLLSATANLRTDPGGMPKDTQCHPFS